MQQAIRPIVSLGLIILSVLGLMNVYGDNTEVEADARHTACPPPTDGTRPCEATLRQVARTPLSQSFHFVTDDAKTVVVECSRAVIFLGDYSCEQE